jgi:hypothetical protein
MKKIAATFLAVLFGTSLTFAHQMEGGSTQGLFGLKAEYVHVLLNPLPVYGLSMGVLVLAAGLLARSKAARNIGLLVIVICAASAWPVLYYGQHGYNHLYPQLDTESQQWLDDHMERAERFIYAFYLTALLGSAALVTQKKFPRVAKALTGITLAAAIASLGIGGWISRAGGEVSHSEFRNEDEPPSAPAHEHDMRPQSHGGMQMSDTNGTHQSAPTTAQVVPNTPEGIWAELHKHQTALQSAVQSKKLDEIHPHAVAIKELTKALVDVVHPDHKAAVQSGVDNVNRALAELHKSADAGDEAAAETNFKNFAEVLKQLEEQMNKQ